MRKHIAVFAVILAFGVGVGSGFQLHSSYVEVDRAFEVSDLKAEIQLQKTLLEECKKAPQAKQQPQ